MSEKSEISSKEKEERILVDKENKFSSTFSTYLTLLGYSIGIADFWRFPFLLYRNGGGICFFFIFTKITFFTMFACFNIRKCNSSISSRYIQQKANVFLLLFKYLLMM